MFRQQEKLIFFIFQKNTGQRKIPPKNKLFLNSYYNHIRSNGHGIRFAGHRIMNLKLDDCMAGLSRCR